MRLNRAAEQSGEGNGSSFRPGVRLTLFVAVFLPLTLALGNWQLNRAEEKLAMQESYLANITQLPVVPDAQTTLDPFKRVKLDGHLRPEVFLVDNQISDRQAGYWAVQVLEQTNGVRWLVNRGFFPAPGSREQLPDIPTSDQPVSVVGVAWPYTGLVPLLAEDPWPGSWPQRVQRLNTARMAELTGAQDVEIRLEQSALAPRPAPFVTVLSRDKHLGYAATWFGLALALLVLYLVAGWRRSDES